MSLSVPLEPPSKEILHISAHYLVILVKYIYSIQFNSIQKTSLSLSRSFYSLCHFFRHRCTTLAKKKKKKRNGHLDYA